MTLRVMTWNLWWKFGPWKERQPAISAVITAAAPDILCLQEVYPAADGAPDQATQLGRQLGYDTTITSFDESRPWMGNAVVSRWPVVEHHVLTLPGRPGRRGLRSAVLAVVDAPCGPVPVVSTHLAWEFDASGERCAQVKAIAGFLAEHEHLASEFPFVLCGDMNARPDSDEMRLLFGLTPGLPAGRVFQDAWERANGPAELGYTWAETNPHKEAAQWPGRRLDYILVSAPRSVPNGTVLEARLVGTEAIGGVFGSDHYGVVADLDHLP